MLKKTISSLLGGALHPQFELSSPQHLVHVHLEDKTAGPAPRVLWDAVYDMGGTEVLKGNAKALEDGSVRPDMEMICPPRNGPPHWYELTISKEKHWGRSRPQMMQDFLASQVITAYRPDHDPALNAFKVKNDPSWVDKLSSSQQPGTQSSSQQSGTQSSSQQVGSKSSSIATKQL